MADKALRDFQKRSKRVEKAYARGRGFEAAGTLGRSHYQTRRRSGGARVLMPLLALGALLVVVKSTMALRLDPEVYAGRIDDLRRGGIIEQAGAMVLQPDPLSGAVAGWIDTRF